MRSGIRVCEKIKGNRSTSREAEDQGFKEASSFCHRRSGLAEIKKFYITHLFGLLGWKRCVRSTGQQGVVIQIVKPGNILGIKESTISTYSILVIQQHIENTKCWESFLQQFEKVMALANFFTLKQPDNLDELLEYPSPLVPAIDNDKTIHLSEAEWLFSGEEDQLQAEDNEVEVKELGAIEEDEDHQSEDRFSINSAIDGTELTFVNMDPSSHDVSCKRKQLAEHVSADERLLKAPSKKRRLVDDKVIDKLLLRKSKKATMRGKRVCERSVPLSDASEGMADEDADAPRTFTVYVQVWSASSTTEKKASKAVKGPAIITRGPFKTDMSQTFQNFKEAVADWKFENPQNAPCKKIANAAGFEVLIDAVRAKQTNDNVIVWLYTPKPVKEEEDWDTGNPDCVKNPLDFDDEAGLEQGMTSKKSLICPIFPHMRVWHIKNNNTYFELTQMRISMWTTAIAAGRATTLMPPTSLHFADDKKLKMPSSITQPASDTPISAFDEFYHQHHKEQIAAVALHAQVPQVPPSAPQPQHVPHVPQGPPGYRFHPGHYYPPYMPQPPFTGPPMQGHTQGFGGPPLAGPPGETSSASSSPSVTMSHNILLSEFCIKYNISASNQAKLSALKYMPGNRAVEAFEEKEWHDVGQFTKLGWQAFLTTHVHKGNTFCPGICYRDFPYIVTIVPKATRGSIDKCLLYSSL
ncbi:hypothetical protein DEU56DRAFT_754385 [Suillus clintonianus]|uniref:uncharacterized protein n=1 Tax=Suillus clintonianus TaxID=1904413 RepID=UPI001B8610E3|nr:uncharacterized protein DEU56DRAFT_754385 [Suillus clintonianus]KAG2144339.1 hypothetical protein DEU56DRAFT_754385 [Suillus clintonianus]